jgi:cytochrome c-type biogenesis protein CcmH
LLQGQLDRPDIAFRVWVDTLRQGPKGAPWINGIEAQIEDMAFRAGIEYSPISPPGAAGAQAPALAGPNAEDLEAAQEMTAEGRQEMIRGMVARLSDRLATEGGSAPEWAQLIGALGVLGEQDRAKAIYAEAKTRFADDTEALAQLESAASMAGLEP